jgi:hypothetical protein
VSWNWPVKKLTDKLARARADSVEARALAERIACEIDIARDALRLPKP